MRMTLGTNVHHRQHDGEQLPVWAVADPRPIRRNLLNPTHLCVFVVHHPG